MKSEAIICAGIFLLTFCGIGCAGNQAKLLTEVPGIEWEKVKIRPHNVDFFTQGLEFDPEGNLLESTGIYGESKLLKYKGETSQVLIEKSLPKVFFGEGATIFRNRVYQLTWQEGVCFVYDLEDLEPQKIFRYQHEGWGLTHDENSLIVSDGSHEIRYYNPTSFEVEKKIEVKVGEHELENLNELEWIDGKIWANIWKTDWVVVIDPSSGAVVGKLDLSPLSKLQKGKYADVLNGIAYHAETKNIWVTGKNWDTIYVLKIKAEQE